MSVPEEARCLYINALYPTDEEASVLDPDSDLASGIHRVLVGWLDARFTRDRQVELREARMVVGLSDAEVRALRLLEFLRGSTAVLARRGRCLTSEWS